MVWPFKRKKEWTPEAQELWNSLTSEKQSAIVGCVFCTRCMHAEGVPMVDYTGKVNEYGDLILNGKCQKCGHAVTRLVETGA